MKRAVAEQRENTVMLSIESVNAEQGESTKKPRQVSFQKPEGKPSA